MVLEFGLQEAILGWLWGAFTMTMEQTFPKADRREK
jgi:hypothetical protein